MINNIINFIKTSIIRTLSKEDIDYSTWVFSSSFNTKFNYNSKYLFEYIIENEHEINPIYVINDDELRSKLQNKYGEKYFIESKSLFGIKKILNAGVWFTSAGLPVYGFKLNQNRTIVNLWHGVPLKKIGLLENNLSLLTKIYFKYIFSDNYTYVMTTSSKLIDVMKNSFDVDEKKVKVLGQPRNDAIFKENKKHKILLSLYKNLPSYKNIILYAPTFRENKGTQFFPFDDFDIKRLKIYLEENELIIFIRCHQSEIDKVVNHDLGERVKFINNDKVEEIMDIINIFDLLITDYSSIYIDYLLTENPLIFLPYDKENYLKNRGLNFKYDSVTPGPKPLTFKDFKTEIIRLLSDSNYFRTERQVINNFFNEVKGDTSQNICNFIKKNLTNHEEGKYL